MFMSVEERYTLFEQKVEEANLEIYIYIYIYIYVFLLRN